MPRDRKKEAKIPRKQERAWHPTGPPANLAPGPAPPRQDAASQTMPPSPQPPPTAAAAAAASHQDDAGVDNRARNLHDTPSSIPPSIDKQRPSSIRTVPAIPDFARGGLPPLWSAGAVWGPGATYMRPCHADGTIRSEYKRARLRDIARYPVLLDAPAPRATTTTNQLRTTVSRCVWFPVHTQQVCADKHFLPADERADFGDLHKQLRELWYTHLELTLLYPPPGEGPNTLVPVVAVVASAAARHDNNSHGADGSGSGSAQQQQGAGASGGGGGAAPTTNAMTVYVPSTSPGQPLMVPRVLRDFILAMNPDLLAVWRPFGRDQPAWNVDSAHAFLEDFSCFLRHNAMFRGQPDVVLMNAPQIPGWAYRPHIRFILYPRFRGYHERRLEGLTAWEAELDRRAGQTDSSEDGTTGSSSNSNSNNNNSSSNNNNNTAAPASASAPAAEKKKEAKAPSSSSSKKASSSSSGKQPTSGSKSASDKAHSGKTASSKGSSKGSSKKTASKKVSTKK